MTDDDDLSKYRDAFVVCRTFGHSWRIATSQVSPDSQHSWLLILKCRSCRAERHDIVSSTSDTLISRRYEHPDGYLRAHHPNVRTEYRLELITRQQR